MSDVLTAREVAQRLGMSVETVYRQLSRGEFPIPALRIGGRWKFSRTVVDQFLSCPTGDGDGHRQATPVSSPVGPTPEVPR